MLDLIIEANLGLVHSQLITYNLANDHEAISLGYEALYKAIQNYDSTKRASLSTFATVCIKNTLGCYIRKLNGVRQLDVMSYNCCITDSDGTQRELLESIPSDELVEENYITSEIYGTLVDITTAEIENTTNQTHKRILMSWQDSEYSKTTTDIAKEVQVSQSYVSQVLSRFKAIIRKKMEMYL